MYSQQLSNNPFVNDPTNAHSRFPDISASSSPFQSTPTPQYGWAPAPAPPAPASTGYLNQGAQSPGSPFGSQVYPQHQPSFDNAFHLGQQPLAAPTTSTMSTPFAQPFQPSSAFGQQLFGGGQLSGSSYGYLQGNNSTGSPGSTGGGGGGGGLSLAQQQIRNNPGYVPQFDPYGPIGQGWDGMQQSTGSTQLQSNTSGYGLATSPTRSTFSTATTSSSSSAGPPGSPPHPRDFIRTHKAELESWDTYAWKQLFNTFDGLKDAWAARTEELRGIAAQVQAQVQYATASGSIYAGQAQQELVGMQQMVKDANSNTDSVAASLFQMKEVYSGYRQSGDLASKRRVRESCNAALQSLPEWPQQQQRQVY